MTSAREMLSQGSAAVTVRLERRRVSGCSEWAARLEAGPVAGPAELVVAFGVGLELVLDFCRSRKEILD